MYRTFPSPLVGEGGRRPEGGCLIIHITLQRAQSLRKNLTEAEHKLWYHLRRGNLKEWRFRKQVPLGKYIVDFICYTKNLIIEIDGGGHNEEVTLQYDAVRTTWLESQGYLIQRFWNHEVLCHIEEVLEEILRVGEEQKKGRK